MFVVVVLVVVAVAVAALVGLLFQFGEREGASAFELLTSKCNSINHHQSGRHGGGQIEPLW